MGVIAAQRRMMRPNRVLKPFPLARAAKLVLITTTQLEAAITLVVRG
jgi:hypothetical protein